MTLAALVHQVVPSADGTTPLQLPSVEYSALLPMLLLIGGALLILVFSSLTPKRLPGATWVVLTLATCGASAGSAIWLWRDIGDNGPRTAVASAVAVDRFAVFATFTLCSAVALFALNVDAYLQREGLDGPEAYVLALLSASGGVLMAFANDLLVLFLGLEILSIALYVMAGFHRRRQESGEAAMKYFVLGAFSSALFLYGIALTYGATGSTRFDQIQSYIAGRVAIGGGRGLLLAGMALLLVGLGFKVAAVPFHTWTPDVYQGSPTPVTGFMAAAAKTAGFAGLLRVFFSALGGLREDWRPAIFTLAALTLVVGSVLALVQTDVKRMLAYSSVNHAGYVLLGVYAASPAGASAAQYYLLTYAFTVLGSFAVASVVGGTGDARHSLDDWKGLSTRRPVLAVAMTIFLGAQAGIPFTTGFLAKFGVIRAAIDTGEGAGYALGIIAMLVTAAAAFFYLRLILTMFSPPTELEDVDDHAEGAGGVALAIRAKARTELAVAPATAAAIAVSLVMTVGAGLWAGPLVDAADRATFLFH